MTAKTPAHRRLTLGEIRLARVETWIGRVIVAGAGIAAAVSFWQIKWTASLIGIPPLATWGFPAIVDGIGTVMAALTMSVHSRPFRQRAYVWSFFLVFISISLFCNALHAAVYVHAHPLALPGELAGAQWGIVFLLAAIPPVGAAIGMHAFAFTRRHGVVADVRASAADTRTLTGEPARARTPEPAVHAPPPAAVHARPDARPPASAAPAVRTPAVTSEDDRWGRLLADKTRRDAWLLYQQLREAGARPSVKAVRDQVAPDRDRSTVSRWLKDFDARWAATRAPVHARPGETGDAVGALGVHAVAHTGNGRVHGVQ